MAISFVGSKTFTHADITAQSVSLTDLKDESNNNATLLHGDYVVINYAIATANVNRTNAQMTPNGYTEFINTDLYANDSNDANQLVSYKKMGTTPDTTVEIPASNATSAGVAVTIYAFRGVDQTTPSDVTPTTATGNNTGAANCPSITPSTAGAWIVGHGAAAVAAGAVFTNPTGMSTTTNHFQSATISTTTTDANVGTCLKTDWTSGPYDIAVFGGSTSTNTGSWCATTIALRPQAPISVTPGTASLTLAAFAPTVAVPEPQLVTPSIATLAVTAYSPAVIVGTALVPTTAVLTTAAFAPTIATPVTVTPQNATLALAAFAPTIATPVTVTPETATLALAAFAPTVVAPVTVTVTPETATLALAAFAPSVATGNAWVLVSDTIPGADRDYTDTGLAAETTYEYRLRAIYSTGVSAWSDIAEATTLVGNVTVTPETATLALAAFAPTIATPVTVTPQNATLALAAFAPTVVAPVTVTPSASALTTVTFAPSVTASADILATPATANITLSSFAPTVTAGGSVSAVPSNATLVLTAYAPTVATPVTATPSVVSLSLTAYAPTVVTPVAVTPATANISLTTFASTVTFTNNTTVTPVAASLTTSRYTPSVTTGGPVSVVPINATLTISTFTPTIQTPVTTTPSTATLVLTSHVAEVLTPVTVTPNTATLVLTTFPPTLGGTWPSHYYYYHELMLT